jgi:hypothetical protein
MPPTITELAHMTMKSMGAENARKRQILQRSPHLAYGMDAAAFAGMSSRDLATRELKELGITPGDNDDPEMMLNMHHAGRQWARGMKGGEAAAGGLIGGSAQDSASGSFLSKYLES